MRSSTGKTTDSRNKAVVLFGPTAVGKTALTEELFSDGFEIINADSVQVYRGLDIGSAKPDERLRALIPHHLLDIRNPWEQYTAGDFVRDAEAMISDISSRSHIPLITGGTAYYFRSLIYGPPAAPPSDASVRARVAAMIDEKGKERAYSYLEEIDPVSAARISRSDIYRISRAIEVYEGSGRPLSSFPVPDSPRSDIDFVIIGLAREKSELARRIDLRIDEMFRMGFYDELRRLMESGAERSWPGMKAIGYREALDAAESGEASIRVLKEEISRSTRQYAKRQMTFFSSFSECRFFHPDDRKGIASYLESSGISLHGLIA